MRTSFWYIFYTCNKHVLTVIVNCYFPERRGFPVCWGWCSYWGLSAGSTKMLLKRDNQEIFHRKLVSMIYSTCGYMQLFPTLDMRNGSYLSFFGGMNKNHYSPVSMKLHNYVSKCCFEMQFNLWLNIKKTLRINAFMYTSYQVICFLLFSVN